MPSPEQLRLLKEWADAAGKALSTWAEYCEVNPTLVANRNLTKLKHTYRDDTWRKFEAGRERWLREHEGIAAPEPDIPFGIPDDLFRLACAAALTKFEDKLDPRIPDALLSTCKAAARRLRRTGEIDREAVEELAEMVVRDTLGVTPSKG